MKNILKKIYDAIHNTEDFLACSILILLSAYPAMEIVARKLFTTGIPDSTVYIQHFVLWITFVGGMITSRENNHLALTAGVDMMTGELKNWVTVATSAVSAFITSAVFWAAFSLVFIGFDKNQMIGIFPIHVASSIMPIGYAFIAFRFVVRAPEGLKGRMIALAGILLGTFISLTQVTNILSSYSIQIPGFLDTLREWSVSFGGIIATPMIILLLVATLLGTPVFVVLGGIAYLLFVNSGGSLESIPNEAYTVLTGNALAAIPLFSLAGFILSASKSGERLMELFRALFGWLPGGIVIMVILVCAFFTTFTGASGVTILALGGLLSYVLLHTAKLPESFSLGLLTASGSIGLLFPPSLPIILYGVIAQINIKEMFIGGLLPGIVMVLTLSVYGVIVAVKNKVEPVPFHVKTAAKATVGGIWEIFLPFIILIGFLGGLFTIVEAGAVSVIYCLFITTIVHRDIPITQLPSIMLKSVPVIGGILVILAMARGLSYYIVDVEIPVKLTTWTMQYIHSKYVFLLFLNILLLLVGCLMDIYSAIIVVVPLIVPVSQAFGIHPVHLGIIFLANLELGYLTPPVGLNLFLAAYRFERNLSTIYRYAIPFFFVMLISLLIITYIPWFSTGLLDVIKF
jgi:tripartite ATP-independent transporter DctM subunit